MKRIYLFYLFSFLGITSIYFLLIQTTNLDINIIDNSKEIIFYENSSNQIEGVYLPVLNEIEDQFLYLTVKRNTLPAYSNTYSDSRLELINYKIENNFLTLYLNDYYNYLENKDKFNLLLYETYSILEYDTIIISCNNIDTILTSDVILSLHITSNYEIKDLNGNYKRVYSISDDIISLKYLIIDDLDINYILKDIEGISYKYTKDNINISILDKSNELLLTYLINLNFINSGFSFTII